MEPLPDTEHRCMITKLSRTMHVQPITLERINGMDIIGVLIEPILKREHFTIFIAYLHRSLGSKRM